MNDGRTCRWSPTLTLSMTGLSPNSRMFWNVRAIPRRETFQAGPPVMSVPWKAIDPRVGGRKPESTLNSVVLPAPFGPMTPWIEPAGSWRS